MAGLDKEQTVKRRKDSDGGSKSAAANGQAAGAGGATEPNSQPRRAARSEEVVDVLPHGLDDDGYVSRHSHMKYELRDTPGLGNFLCFFSIIY